MAIGWAVRTLSWGQVKFCLASVAWWPWPKVTKMGAKPYVNHVWFEETSFRGFPGKWINVGRTVAARWKRTKNNKSRGYPGWLQYGMSCSKCLLNRSSIYWYFKKIPPKCQFRNTAPISELSINASWWEGLSRRGRWWGGEGQSTLHTRPKIDRYMVNQLDLPGMYLKYLPVLHTWYTQRTIINLYPEIVYRFCLWWAIF